MRHFRLNFFGCIAGSIVFAVLSALCFRAGSWAAGVLLLIPSGVAVAALWRLVRRLIFSMSEFVEALEMNDPTIRFPESGDPCISRMSQAMRRITGLYNSARLELETRKLYYDRILRIMTHEMRNAIAYQGENFREAVGLISDESEGISRFLESYYELTHLPAPQTAEIDVKDFFSGLRRSFMIFLRESGLPDDTISYTLPVGMTLRADRGLLNRLVTNVLRNAVEAVASAPEPRIEVSVSSSGGHPFISIDDNGRGIPPEVMQNLFQPFFTTKPGGSGIGLCLSRQIARLHGGDFTLTSSARGTKALITLP